jgi:hypothetical protein
MTKQELFELSADRKDFDRQDNFILLHEFEEDEEEVYSCETYEQLEKRLSSEAKPFGYGLFAVVDLKEKVVHVIYQEDLVAYFKNKEKEKAL